MSAATVVAPTATDRPGVATVPRVGFSHALRAEWLKLTSVRSTWWILTTTFLLGAGLTIAICWGNAEWLASDGADEPAGAFITWGMTIAAICSVILGALVVTTEYGTGMIRTSFAAVTSRSRVLLAKALLVFVVMFALGTITALVGYLGGNYFLDREGIGLALEGDVLRSMYGSGLFLGTVGLFTVAIGFILRHTAGTISVVLAVMLILGNMVMLVPGTFGEWLTKLMPGNAGAGISAPASFNPDLLGPWVGFGVFAAQTAALLVVALLVVRRRDA